jgi:hypothetical protein
VELHLPDITGEEVLRRLRAGAYRVDAGGGDHR